MPRITWKQMAKYPMILPPAEVSTYFSEQVRTWAAQIIHNIEESRTLAETRDYLLPKLLSGEVEVGATADMMEDLL